jgi:hypothetical protein
VAGCFEHGNESSGSIKCGEFLASSFSRRTPLHGVNSKYPYTIVLLKVAVRSCIRLSI